MTMGFSGTMEAARNACRVLVVASKYLPEYTGAAVRVHRTYRRVGGELTQLGVVCGSEQYAAPDEYAVDDVPVTRITAGGFHDWSSTRRPWRRLRYALRCWIEAINVWSALGRRPRPDVLHVFGSSAVTATAIWWAYFRGVPTLIELVTTGARPHQYLPGQKWWWPFRLRRRVAVIAISDVLREASCSEGLGRSTWSRPNPVDTRHFRPASDGEKMVLRSAHTPFPAQAKLMCMVGKFMQQKNQEFLLDVLARLPAEWKLVMAGPLVGEGRLGSRDAHYIERVRRRIEALNLGERVLLLTEFVDTAEWMRLSDVYVLPNTREGLGTPMLEAMSCGVPVVANAGEAAFRQWVVPGWNGRLVPLDAAAWADAVLESAATPARQREDVAAWAQEKFSFEAIDRGFAELVRRLAATPPGAVLDIHAPAGGGSA